MLKQSLEGGRRGDDVHQPWMDTMVRLGIKQVVFRIRYAGCNKGTALKIENTRYLSSYYDDDSRIKKKAILRQVKDTGLEKALADAILSRAEALVSYDKERLKTDPTMRELNSSELCGTMFLNLLDDEMLPVSDEPGIIDSGCGRHC